MQLSRKVLFGVVAASSLAWAAVRWHDKRRPARPSLHLTGWQKFLGAAAVVLAVLMILNPEFFAFGIVMDSAFFDLLVLLISLQLQLIGAQTWRKVRAASAWTASKVIAAMKRSAFRMSFLSRYLAGSMKESVHQLYSFLRRREPAQRNGP